MDVRLTKGDGYLLLLFLFYIQARAQHTPHNTHTQPITYQRLQLGNFHKIKLAHKVVKVLVAGVHMCLLQEISHKREEEKKKRGVVNMTKVA
jgi:hypothetical protein